MLNFCEIGSITFLDVYWLKNSENDAMKDEARWTG